MVEQIESAHRSRLVLQVITDLQPCLRGAVRVLACFLELLLVELASGDLLELLDRGVELGAHIADLAVVDVNVVVVGDIDHDQRDVCHTGNVLIPLGHAVADVVAAQDEVRLRHAVLTDGLQGLQAELSLLLILDLLDVEDVDQLLIRGLSLRILLRLAGRLIDDRLAVCIL